MMPRAECILVMVDSVFAFYRAARSNQNKITLIEPTHWT